MRGTYPAPFPLGSFQQPFGDRVKKKKNAALGAQIGERTCPNLGVTRSIPRPDFPSSLPTADAAPSPGRPWVARVWPSSGPGAVGTPRARPCSPDAALSRGGQWGLLVPRAGAAANIDFGKHHFAPSAGRGRGRPDPGGGGSGSAFRRGH